MFGVITTAMMLNKVTKLLFLKGKHKCWQVNHLI